MLSQACQTYYQKRILCRIIIYPAHSTQCSLNLLCRSTLAHLALAPVLIPQTRPKHRSTHTQIFIEYINVYEHKEHRDRNAFLSASELCVAVSAAALIPPSRPKQRKRPAADSCLSSSSFKTSSSSEIGILLGRF